MLHKCHFLELLSILYSVSSWFEKCHHFRLDFWRFSTCYYHSAVTLKNRTLPLKWLSYSFNITCSLNMWFSGNSDCKASSWNTGDLGLIPESRRSAGEGNGYPLRLVGYSPWGHQSQTTERTSWSPYIKSGYGEIKWKNFELVSNWWSLCWI